MENKKSSQTAGTASEVRFGFILQICVCLILLSFLILSINKRVENERLLVEQQQAIEEQLQAFKEQRKKLEEQLKVQQIEMQKMELIINRSQ